MEWLGYDYAGSKTLAPYVIAFDKLFLNFRVLWNVYWERQSVSVLSGFLWLLQAVVHLFLRCIVPSKYYTHFCNSQPKHLRFAEFIFVNF